MFIRIFLHSTRLLHKTALGKTFVSHNGKEALTRYTCMETYTTLSAKSNDQNLSSNRHYKDSISSYIFSKECFASDYCDDYLDKIEGTLSLMDYLATDDYTVESSKYDLARPDIVKSQQLKLSLLKVEPQTGRTHQIRAHLASVGLPLCGDFLYNRGIIRLYQKLKKKVGREGGNRSDEIAECQINKAENGGNINSQAPNWKKFHERLFLHSSQVSFYDVDGTYVDIEAPLPTELMGVLNICRDVNYHISNTDTTYAV